MSEAVRLDPATLDYVAAEARKAARALNEQCGPGRYRKGAVDALLALALTLSESGCVSNDGGQTLVALVVTDSMVGDGAVKATLATSRAERETARLKGYTGDCCPDCGSMSMVRNGMCLKCDACGATTGCS